MHATGMWAEVAAGLRFFAKYQRADGKIPHEISQAAARIPWFTDFPYTYYHLDTTPYWIVALWRYWLATGDRELPDEATLDAVRGLTGDNWQTRGSKSTQDGSADPQRQVTVMNARAAELVAASDELLQEV